MNYFLSHHYASKCLHPVSKLIVVKILKILVVVWRFSHGSRVSLFIVYMQIGGVMDKCIIFCRPKPDHRCAKNKYINLIAWLILINWFSKTTEESCCYIQYMMFSCEALPSWTPDGSSTLDFWWMECIQWDISVHVSGTVQYQITVFKVRCTMTFNNLDKSHIKGLTYFTSSDHNKR